MSHPSDWLAKWSVAAPNAVAFSEADSEREFTYGIMHFVTRRLARELSSRFGVRKGDRVAVLATNEIEYPVLFFAIQYLGAMMVPVNFRLAPREVSHVVSDSDAKLVIAQRQFDALLLDVSANRWPFDGDDSLTSFVNHAFADDGRSENSTLEFQGDEDSPCMILYTSGTTGTPKGALVTNSMLYWNSMNTSRRLNLSANDVHASFLPFFHTGGWNVLLTPFVHHGARTVVMKRFDPVKVLDLCERERVTILFGVPTTMEMMAATPRFANCDLSSVRYAIVGGEPMSTDLIRLWQNKGVAIRQGYGLTEFGPNVFSLDAEDAIRKIGSIGTPNDFVEARIVDDSGREVGVGQIGELVLRGSVCTPGYWKNPEATAKTIVDGWLHTGDLVRKDEEGYYFVVGRKKEMFISGGENVYPAEIERCLAAHPAIREVAVIGVADAKWGEVGAAFVALNAGASLSAEELLTYCSSNLAKFKVPKHVVFLPELPKGDSGKIQKRALRLGN